jgi:cytochrome P450
MAGHETTAGGITSTIHFLADNPECQQKLYDEILRVCGNAEPTYEHLKDVTFLHPYIYPIH